MVVRDSSFFIPGMLSTKGQPCYSGVDFRWGICKAWLNFSCLIGDARIFNLTLREVSCLISRSCSALAHVAFSRFPGSNLVTLKCLARVVWSVVGRDAHWRRKSRTGACMSVLRWFENRSPCFLKSVCPPSMNVYLRRKWEVVVPNFPD